MNENTDVPQIVITDCAQTDQKALAEVDRPSLVKKTVREKTLPIPSRRLDTDNANVDHLKLPQVSILQYQRIVKAVEVALEGGPRPIVLDVRDCNEELCPTEFYLEYRPATRAAAVRLLQHLYVMEPREQSRLLNAVYQRDCLFADHATDQALVARCCGTAAVGTFVREYEIEHLSAHLYVQSVYDFGLENGDVCHDS